MGQFHSFAEVLENKIREEILKEYSASPSAKTAESKIFDDSPTCLSHILGSLTKVRLTQESKAQAYHKFRTPPKPRPPHNLNEAQAKAFACFGAHDSLLSPAFTLKELKSAFRTVALKVHPDQGGTALQFMELKKAFDILKTVPSK